MKVYAIGDLHLSFTENKPMDVFGANWHEHYKKVESKWREKITEEDFCSFGKLSSELHHAILDDPAPYRKSIKEFVEILFC